MKKLWFGLVMCLVVVFAFSHCKDEKRKRDKDKGLSEASLRKRTVEAIDEIDKIVKGAAFYYTKPYIDGNGQKQPCQFPASQGQTPLEATCCSDNHLGGPDSNENNRCDSNPDLWTELTWSSLTFQLNDEHYFVYSFDSSGVLSQAQFTASAFGDLDCDGVQSTFQRIGWGDPQANYAECAMYGSPAFFVEKEIE